jgi:hypothetical protein
MEQIEGAWRITDADHCSDLLIAAFVTMGNLSGLQEHRAPVSAFQFDVDEFLKAITTPAQNARGEPRCVRASIGFLSCPIVRRLDMAARTGVRERAARSTQRHGHPRQPMAIRATIERYFHELARRQQGRRRPLVYRLLG